MAEPMVYKHLDATQLLKHYLGLKRASPRGGATVVYLYWRPANWRTIDGCVQHEDELSRFQAAFSDAELKFVALQYDIMWEEWARSQNRAIAAHAGELIKRYAGSI
jgi:hypothetical protein